MVLRVFGAFRILSSLNSQTCKNSSLKHEIQSLKHVKSISGGNLMGLIGLLMFKVLLHLNNFNNTPLDMVIY